MDKFTREIEENGFVSILIKVFLLGILEINVFFKGKERVGIVYRKINK